MHFVNFSNNPEKLCKIVQVTDNFNWFSDGLVSYNAPAGEQMNLPSFPVYVNDSVYDGAVTHR